MDLVGQTLDIYRICEPLGSGMTATVYRAVIEGTLRDVAVKVLQREVREDETFLKRFYREGMICAQINHPNLLRVYQVSDQNAEIQYIVTDLIVGVNLSQFLTGNPMTCPELAVLLTLPVLKGLFALHERGVVHRDIKPDNIMVDWSKKRVVITDLGLAQPLDGSRLSVVGQIVGSIAFMAPERMRDAPFDHRVDIWSVGTILYYLATGAFPFDAESQDEFVRRVLKAQVKPPSEVNPAVAPELERVILGCLAGDPNARYDSAQKIRDDLERHLRELEIGEPEGLLVDYLASPRTFAEPFRALVAERMRAKASRVDPVQAGELLGRVAFYESSSAPSRSRVPTESGDPSARSENPSARSENPSARSGDPSTRSGDPSARSGDPSARSGDPSAPGGSGASVRPARGTERRASRDDAVIGFAPAGSAGPTPLAEDVLSSRDTPSELRRRRANSSGSLARRTPGAADLPIRTVATTGSAAENRALVLGILIGALIGLSMASALFLFYWYLLR